MDDNNYSDIKKHIPLSSNVYTFCIIMNRIGFDLENSYFYVFGSNVQNVMHIGSSDATSTLCIYANDDKNAASYHVGVDASDPPLFWIGKQISGVDDNYIYNPRFYIRDNNVGIGISDPQYPLDIHGDMRVTGQLIQEGNSTSIQTDLVAVNNIIGGTTLGINMNNTNMYNLGAVTTNGLQTHAMNDTMHVQYMQTTGMKNSIG